MDWERTIDVTLFLGCRLWEAFRFRVLSHTRNFWRHYLHGLVRSFLAFTSISQPIHFDRQDIHVITSPATAILPGEGIIINIKCFIELTSTLQVFLSQGLGMGIGLGLSFIPTASITVHYFKRRRALATGIVLSGGATGSVIFPISENSPPSSPHPRLFFPGNISAQVKVSIILSS